MPVLPRQIPNLESTDAKEWLKTVIRRIFQQIYDLRDWVRPRLITAVEIGSTGSGAGGVGALSASPLTATDTTDTDGFGEIVPNPDGDGSTLRFFFPPGNLIVAKNGTVVATRPEM